MTKLLISAIWDEKKNIPFLKYYDLDREIIQLQRDWHYKNHWLSSNPKDGKRVKLYDSLYDKDIALYRHEGDGHIPKEERDQWVFYEHKLRKHHNYLLTKGLICGAIYDSKGNLVKQELDTEQQKALQTMLANAKDLNNPEYLQYLTEYTSILSQPIPSDIKRLAIDIEVYTERGIFPSLRNPYNVVTCIGFVDNRGWKKTFTLSNEKYHKHNPKDKKDFIIYFDNERTLIEAAFETINTYPCIVTFNGDDFDLAYLYQRAKRIGIEKIPIFFNEKDLYKPASQPKDAVLLENAIHLDLFRIFKNKSLHNYAFNAKYKQFSLDSVSMAMLKEGKVKFSKPLNELTQEELSYYCLNDTELTLKLTTYSNNLLIKLLVLISRITKTSIEDIGRFGISNWLKQMMYYEHRKRNILIPNREDLRVKGGASTESIIKDKKYKGAFVMDPVKGIHFNVSVIDFSSLYPSIIKSNNISYETINCGHKECIDNKVPETNHYTCTKKLGLIPLLIGVFRDLRIEYFKKLSKNKTLSKEDQEIYDAITQGVKVILNGSYGVLGAEAFQLYCLPVAESVTALGRHIIQKTKEYVESLGLIVVYGDTDSLFIVNPTDSQLRKIMNYTQDKFKIDIELDKEYRYIMFSGLKKNYFGVKKDGKLDTKGLVGKKSNIPKFVRECFNEICRELAKVQIPEEMGQAKEKVKNIAKTYYNRLNKLDFPIEDFSYNQMINKDVDKYGKVKQRPDYRLVIDRDIFGNDSIGERLTNVPIHAEVAKQKRAAGEQLEEKMFIPFIKTFGNRGKWTKIARKTDIDKGRYKETLITVIKPLFQTLDLDIEQILSGQTNLLEAFI